LSLVLPLAANHPRPRVGRGHEFRNAGALIWWGLVVCDWERGVRDYVARGNWAVL
jgi:hypothetical protein